jgi:uncharacterized membrane protein YeaQ/YmgE (transglycosylase-associated protein family)
MITSNLGIYFPMLEFIVLLIIVGLIVGLLARLFVPGRDNIGILGTILLGIVGSFVGGFLWSLIEFHKLEVHRFHAVGIIGSVIGAIVVLLILRVTGLEPGHGRSRNRGRSRARSTRRRWI